MTSSSANQPTAAAASPSRRLPSYVEAVESLTRCGQTLGQLMDATRDLFAAAPEGGDKFATAVTALRAAHNQALDFADSEKQRYQTGPKLATGASTPPKLHGEGTP